MAKTDKPKKRGRAGIVAWVCVLLIFGLGGGVVTGLMAEGMLPQLFVPMGDLVLLTPPPPSSSSDPNDPWFNFPIEIDEGNWGKNNTIYSFDGKNYKQKQGIVTLLVMGVDTAEFRSIKENGYQTDMLMLCVIDTKNKGARFVNIPRDTYANYNLLKSNGDVRGTKWGKINAAYSQGGGRDKYSYRNACDAVSKLIGAEITYYVGIDMDSVGPLCDAVGGVTMVSEVTLPEYSIRKGETVTLKGDAALTYVRARKGNGLSGSDVDRVKRQMNFIKQYAKKAKSLGFASLITNTLPQVSRYVDFHPKLAVNVMLNLAKAMEGIDFDNMQIQALAGDFQGEYWKPSQSALHELYIDLFFDPV